MVCDSIYFYSKSAKYTFFKQYTSHSDKTLKEWYQFLEFPGGKTRKMTKEELDTQAIPNNARRFNTDNMASPNPRPNLMYEYKGYGYPVKGWRYSKETMEQLDNDGKLLFPADKSGRIMLKRYLDEQDGGVVGDLWADIDQVRAAKSERIGYPTQKPEALLERIIECASKENDLVLDPFLGGGTTAAVADKMKRRWIGIDQSVAAVKVSDLRLKNRRDLYSAPYELQLRTFNYDALRNLEPFEFERRIIERFGGVANDKQRSDFGLDGRMQDNTPIQVKRSDNIGRNVIDNFLSAVQRSDERLFEKNRSAGKTVGYIIAFSFGKGAVEETARLKNKKQVIIELVKVGDIVPLGKPPKVSLSANELEQYKYAFEATAESDAGIEFYSWDFNNKPDEGFKPDVYLDKTGKQVRKFEPGEHKIAAQATDKNGLDGTDKIEIKIEK